MCGLKNINFVVEFCCLNGEAFLRFNFIQYGRHAFSYVLVQVTMNAPLVRVKLLRAINGNPDSYSCLCERSLSLSQTCRYSIYLPKRDGKLSLPGWLVMSCIFHSASTSSNTNQITFPKTKFSKSTKLYQTPK